MAIRQRMASDDKLLPASCGRGANLRPSDDLVTHEGLHWVWRSTLWFRRNIKSGVKTKAKVGVYGVVDYVS